MNTVFQTLVIAAVTVASAAAIGMGLADRTASSNTDIVKLERVVIVGKHVAEEPVVTAWLPRVVVTGHSVAQADMPVAAE